MDTTLIERLARLRGIGDAYHDYRGELKHFSLTTKIGILRAMGCGVDDEAQVVQAVQQLEAARGAGFLPPLIAAPGDELGVAVNITARDFGAMLVWSVVMEDGTRREGTTSSADCPEIWRGEVAGTLITRRHFRLPFELPMGYHELHVKLGAATSDRCLLIASPMRCHEPPAIVAGRRLWGIAVQLYTLRSRDNWGIGDFNDLKTLIRWAANLGAGFIGLNPLHALAPADPDRSSPYSASSRHFLNVLYISVPAVEEFDACATARKRLEDAAVAEQLRALRACELVDYPGVAQLKLEILELLYRDFRERQLATDSARGRGFRAFLEKGGLLLETHARFDALDRHFRTTRECPSGWLSWPEEYRDVHGRAATRFARTHPEQVEFHAWLQWLAHDQLCAAQALTRELNMPVGLYGDYAVGANPAGSETWSDPQSYRMGAEIGAPPDPLALRGQGWGIPPHDPTAMLAERLRGFVQLIRNNMRFYGALRIDHVMSLFRLWWVPGGSSPADGAYVHYPLESMLGILALESARAACLVVGEDLGVVPDEMRRAMPQFSLYHYKVMLFEKLDGRYRRPQEYEPRALATVTTHDMPTLASYWQGLDIELRRRLNLYPSVDIENAVVRERNQDRELLLAALLEQGLNPGHPSRPDEPFSAELAQAMHLYLARSAAILVALQIEDLLGMIDPVNVPGTDREYPNWQRKVTSDIEDIAARGDLAARLAAINEARG